MMRVCGKNRICQLALVATAALVLASGDAWAFSHGSWGSSGSYGSYGSSGSSASYGSYGSSASYGSSGSYGSHGSHGGLRARRAARRAARASHGSSGSSASYGSYGSSGSSGSYGSSGSSASYGSSGSYGSGGSYGSASYSAPVEYSTPVETVCEDCVSSTTSTPMLTAGKASIDVTLPLEAKVYVNDKLTTSTGSARSFVSNGLDQGKTYAYRMRVEYQLDGETVTETKNLKLTAGSQVTLAFGNGAESIAAADPVTTELKLEVPEDARVYLAGAETSQTGSSRSYATTRLSAGQTWDNYTVRVELQRDGKPLVEERTLKLEAGQTYELAFDFGSDSGVQVAQLSN